MARPIQIVPSVLPADFARLGDEVMALEKAGVDSIQWDVMDGRFVPNLTLGLPVVESLLEPLEGVALDMNDLSAELNDLVAFHLEGAGSLRSFT